jgi:predicted GNAT family N-acyltransferase
MHSSGSILRVEQVEVGRLIDLRHRVLRAGLPRESAQFEGDLEPTAMHFAAIQEGSVVGCCTLIQRPWMKLIAWQLRGMAVDKTLQRGGVGSMLLRAVDESKTVREYSNVLWCNAREVALEFYKKHGWVVESEPFDIPTAGPHYKMSKRIR